MNPAAFKSKKSAETHDPAMAKAKRPFLSEAGVNVEQHKHKQGLSQSTSNAEVGRQDPRGSGTTVWWPLTDST